MQKGRILIAYLIRRRVKGHGHDADETPAPFTIVTGERVHRLVHGGGCSAVANKS